MHLEKFQKNENDRWANDMLTMPGMRGLLSDEVSRRCLAHNQPSE